MKKLIFILIITLSLCSAQSQREFQKMLSSSPEELVSISGSMPFNQAMQMLSKMSKQFINKIIVLSEDITDPIGIDIIQMNWYRALMLILKYNNLEFTETEEYIKILPRKAEKPPVPDAMKGVDLSTREVNISAIFFELDVAKSKELGMNWKWLLSSKDVDLAGQLGQVDPNIFNLNPQQTTDQTKNFNLGLYAQSQMGDFLGRATFLFNFFEQNQLGEVIASPQITVRDRVRGEIQVGADFSTREKDFAGNTVERFYSTGTIIRVTPYVFEEDGKNYILIDLEAERSNAIPGQISTEIKKTKAKTDVLLVDGEETVIGGLYITEEKVERSGIPILKDLPWWVFGIRYLTGFDKKTYSKKELIIVLKAKLVPPLKERFTTRKNNLNLIEQTRENYHNQIKIYQMNPVEEK
ncbi:MAG: type II and III secretion system protein [Ignavibacteria bacterium]|nr:type II and III secretion system protein [Ignavibacteria bacterium]